MDKLVINYTPTGMIPTKEMTPYVPVSVDEIVEDVLKASEIGITMVHLHARDDLGAPTYKKEIYGRIMEGIRKFAPDLVICLSLSGRNFNEFSFRSEPIELYPDMGSLTLSSLNFTQQASINSPSMIHDLASKMKAYGVIPELEVFDLGMINYAKYLLQKKLIEEPFYFNIILGNIAGLQCDALEIGTALAQLPSQSYWSLGGIGTAQLPANSIAIALGGGVRIGIEDNIYFNVAAKEKCTNEALLQRIHVLAEIHQRPVMSPSEFGNLGFYNKVKR